MKRRKRIPLVLAAGILMLAATDDNALRPAPQELRDMIRASILKQMLIRTL